LYQILRREPNEMVPQYWTHESGISNIAVLFFIYGMLFQPHQVFDNSSSDEVVFYYKNVCKCSGKKPDALCSHIRFD